MKRALRRILEYLAAITLIILLLLSIAGVVAVKFYGEDLKAYSIEQINQRIDTRVEMDSLELSVFRNFPHMTLSLKEVTLWSSHNFNRRDIPSAGADTLLHAARVDASFHILGLFRGRYKIRSLEVDQGFIHLYTDRKGEVNYRILAANESARAEGPELVVAIEVLRIRDFDLDFINQGIGFRSASRLELLELNGRFSPSEIQLRTQIEGRLKDISNKGVVYASDREVSSRISLEVRDSLFTINKGHMSIDRIVADVEGSFTALRGKGAELDLQARARDLEIHEVLDLLPKEISASLSNLRGKGTLQLDTRVTGLASALETPTLEATFSAQDASLEWELLPFPVQNMSLSGAYSNGGDFNPVSTTLRLDHFEALIGEDRVSLKGGIHNFLDPAFNLEVRGHFHPRQWDMRYPDFPLDHWDGSLENDLRVSGKVAREKKGGEKLLSFDLEGDLVLRDLAFRLPGSELDLTGIEGSISIRNDYWEPEFSGAYGTSDFQVQAKGKNLISYLLGREEYLVASGDLKSKRVDLQEIFSSFTKTQGKDKAALLLPQNLQLHLGFAIQELVKKDFRVEQLRGVASYEAPLFRLDSLNMQGMGGSLSGDGSLVYDPRIGASMQVDASMYELDIQRLFIGFNDFGMKELTHEKLKGSISGTSTFSADFDTLFRMIPASILSESELKISNGELNDFAPMEALSRFVELEELRNIRFSTLENNILIADRQIYIPSMDIRSNALNLMASGVHGFDQDYDYRISLRLSEILYKKSREEGREFEVRDDESDRRTLFLRIQNEGSGAKVSRDRERSVEKRRQDLQQEKEELKEILRREFGFSKKQEEGFHSEEVDPAEDDHSLQFDLPEEENAKADSAKVEEKPRRSWFKRNKAVEDEENKPAKEFVLDDG